MILRLIAVSAMKVYKMRVGFTLLGLLFSVASTTSDTLPTSYEYYTSDGISSGLSADQSYFTLNGKNISIYSGAMHYFRVPRAYWRDRLKKIRAAGLNTVETYIAWNLHEPQSGIYDFGDGGSEMEDFLHITEFLETAQQEDLFVIVRSGPYICSEYNFGGFPSWLLREKQIGFRTNEETYVKYFRRYFDVLMPILAEYQFTKGGPIIAFQVENEYGYMHSNHYTPDREYLENIRQGLLQNNIVELLVTSDGTLASGDIGTIPGVLLQTANFGNDPEPYFDRLRELQPNKPVMAMEFWIGWFDLWSGTHSTKDVATAKDLYERILKYPASVNIYMFHGGSNFAYNSGAGLSNSLFDNSGLQPITTSYDYDAPLNEGGDYTDKYYAVKELIGKYNPVKTLTPELPELIPKVAYSAVTVDKQITFSNLIETDVSLVLVSEIVIAMERLDINNHSGQSNGYIVYRNEHVDLEAETVLKIEGHICDSAMVLVDGVLVSPILKDSSDLDNFGYWRMENSTLVLNAEEKKGATVDIIVEEWARPNGGSIYEYNQTFKGLWQGQVYYNDVMVSNWKIFPLEFKKDWVNNLKGWSAKASSNGPSLFYSSLEITGEPQDTYIDMRDWTKGMVFVNGFPLGKYAKIGPQQTLYLPAPFLKEGVNDIIIFEHFKAADTVSFVTEQIFYTL